MRHTRRGNPETRLAATVRTRFALSAALLVALAVALVSAASAQQAGESDPDAVDAIEEIVVTGSLIRGTPVDGASPVTVLDRASLEAQNSPTVIEIVRNLGLASGNIGETNQFQVNGGEGMATLNLRGLGPERTLVLLNGRRQAYAGWDFGNLININHVPAIAIERIEVLREGAAATYGSDAVAGVANLQTRSRFSGLEVSGNLTSIPGANGDSQFGIIWGTQYAPDSNVVLSWGRQSRSELSVTEREDWVLQPGSVSISSGWSNIGNPGTWFGLGSFPGLLSGGVGGALATGQAFVDPGCGQGSLERYSFDAGVCRFRYIVFDNLAEEDSHDQLFAEWRHSLGENTRLRVDYIRSNTEVPAWKTSPSYPPQALFGAVQYVFDDHPGLADMKSQTANNWGTLGGVFFGRIVGAAGPAEQASRELRSDRINAMLDFRLAELDIILGLTGGSSTGYIERRDAYIDRTALAFRGLGGANCPAQVTPGGDAVTTEAIGGLAVGDTLYAGVTATSVAGVASSPGTGLAAFRSAAGNRCLHYNPFSNAIPGSPHYNASVANDPALLDWMVDSLETARHTTMLQADVQMSGTLGDFAGGPGRFAAGVQLRRNSFKLSANDVTNLALFPCPNPGDDTCTAPTGRFSFLAGVKPLQVEQDVAALFFEAAMPLRDNLDVQAALRYEDYGSIDSIDPKVSLRWQLSDPLALRASFGTTFRGPTPSQVDAASRITILAFISPTSAFKAVDTIGNPELEPESANILNLGAIWEPSPDLQLTFDYWNFDFSDPIVAENQDQLVDAYIAASAAGSTSPVAGQIFCQGGVLCDDGSGAPLAASGIERIVANWVNGPAVSTSGLDLAFQYAFGWGPGRFELTASYNAVLNYDVDPYIKNGVQVAAGYDALGKLNFSNPALPLPDMRSRHSWSYAVGPHSFIWYVNVIGGYEDQRSSPQAQDIGQHLTHDIHYSVSFANTRGSFTASILNLLDEPPPRGTLELGYDPYTHNAFGRMLKLGLRYTVF